MRKRLPKIEMRIINVAWRRFRRQNVKTETGQQFDAFLTQIGHL